MTGTARLAQLGSGVLVFHVLNSILQEAVFHLPGFHHTVLLTMLQSLCMALIAFGEIRRAGLKRKAPLVTYFMLSLFSTGSGILTNEASRLLNYPTQVLFKSSKLLVVMIVRAGVLRIIGTDAPSKNCNSQPLSHNSGGGDANVGVSPAGSPMLVHENNSRQKAFWKKQFLLELTSAAVIVFGIVSFTYATSKSKMTTQKASQDVLGGIIAIIIAMVCDALLYIGEERFCFKAYDSSNNEVILYCYGLNTVNTFVLTSLGFTGAAGEGASGAHAAGASFSYLSEQPSFIWYVIAFSICNYLGTNVLLKVVGEFDSNAAVMVTSIRKVLTILCSFIIYPKPVGWLHGLGAIAVFVGVYFFEEARKRAKKEKDRSTAGAAEAV